MRIFIVEDNRVDLDLISRALQNSIEGCSIVTARSYNEAIRVLEESEDFDISLIDVMLPDGSGIELLKDMRQRGINEVVVIMTGSGSEEMAVSALKAGADDYIVKNQDFYTRIPAFIQSTLTNNRLESTRLSQKLSVLYAEHHETDIDLTIRHFSRYAPNINISPASTSDDALAMLDLEAAGEAHYDVIVIDYKMPVYNALDLTKMIRQDRKLDTPIVVVTGHGNEEVVIKALRLGADEYLVKRNNYLFRLPSLIMSAYQKHVLGRKTRELEESERRYRLLAENSGDVIFTLDDNWNFAYVSPAMEGVLGYRPSELLNKSFLDIVEGEDQKKVTTLLNSIKEIIPGNGNPTQGPLKVVEMYMAGKDGQRICSETKIRSVSGLDMTGSVILGVIRDITKRKNTEIELIKSREEYKRFFEEDLTGDFISTVNGRLITCNRTYLEIMGFESLEEALEVELVDYYADPQVRQHIVNSVRKEKKLLNFEYDLKRVDGTLIHAIANVLGEFDEKGNLTHLRGYIIDNTERKVANEKLRKISMALEQSPVSIVITDTDGAIEFVNPAFTKITGYNSIEVVGQNPRLFKTGHTSKEEYTRLWDTIKGGGVWTGEFLNRKKDGTTFWERASITGVRDRDNTITHFVAVKEDITQLKENELMLIEARNKAEESDRLKSAFLANISHEIRTPMNGILGFAELLKESMVSGQIEPEYVEIIEQSGHRMLAVINDLVDISMIEAGVVSINLTTFNLYTLAEELYNFFGNEAGKKALEFSLTCEESLKSVVVTTDRTKLSIIISNLLKNAVKFTSRGSVELGLRKENGNLALFVRDTGIGIPEDKHSIIFERFRQVYDSISTPYEGIGLGLSISAAYADKLGGKLSFTSREGAGSEFIYTFSPGKSTVAVKAEEPAKTKQELRGLKVLVAEDDTVNFDYLKIVLRNAGCEVIWAKDGVSAVDAVENDPGIELVLMDIRMPRMDGYDATRAIKKLRPGLPVIAQTAYAKPEDELKSIEAGCNGYISKPINRDTLLELIKSTLEEL